jgi:serine/threonine protein kinase
LQENIVRLRHFTPQGVLFMDYYRFGSLADARKVKDFDAVDKNLIMVQCLQGLSYIHSQRITHRDIKPGNILVGCREPSIHVLLSDLGLSKEGSDLVSDVGTPGYFAPEIMDIFDDPPLSRRDAAPHRPSKRRKSSAAWPHHDLFPKRTNAMDTWSLGVTGLWLSQALPQPKTIGGGWRGRQWFDALVEMAAAFPDAGRGALLKRMLVIDPSRRMSSRGCLELALAQGPDRLEADFITPEASSSGSDNPRGTVSVASRNQETVKVSQELAHQEPQGGSIGPDNAGNQTVLWEDACYSQGLMGHGGPGNSRVLSSNSGEDGGSEQSGSESGCATPMPKEMLGSGQQRNSPSLNLDDLDDSLCVDKDGGARATTPVQGALANDIVQDAPIARSTKNYPPALDGGHTTPPERRAQAFGHAADRLPSLSPESGYMLMPAGPVAGGGGTGARARQWNCGGREWNTVAAGATPRGVFPRVASKRGFDLLVSSSSSEGVDGV